MHTFTLTAIHHWGKKLKENNAALFTDKYWEYLQTGIIYISSDTDSPPIVSNDTIYLENIEWGWTQTWPQNHKLKRFYNKYNTSIHSVHGHKRYCSDNTLNSIQSLSINLEKTNCAK